MIELVPLCTAELEISRSFPVGTAPSGTRLIGLSQQGRFDGERLRGRVADVALDWLTLGADGTGMVDARVIVETDDGALIDVRYQGRIDAREGFGRPVYIAPLFETGDPRYTWLNRIQAVGKGRIGRRAVRYEIYELR